jgi:hypothetical protein
MIPGVRSLMQSLSNTIGSKYTSTAPKKAPCTNATMQ